MSVSINNVLNTMRYLVTKYIYSHFDKFTFLHGRVGCIPVLTFLKKLASRRSIRAGKKKIFQGGKMRQWLSFFRCFVMINRMDKQSSLQFLMVQLHNVSYGNVPGKSYRLDFAT